MIITKQEIADKFGVPVDELVIKMSADKIDVHKNPKAVILNGLEWMTENLAGHGGTEIYGNWYYTWEQAMTAAKEVGDGWRLPTEEEFDALCKLDSTWEEGNNERLFDNKLPFPAGFYWSCSKISAEFYEAGCLYIDRNNGYILSHTFRTHTFSVRLVRDIK